MPSLPPIVILNGYPPVHRVKLMQGSGARPGRGVLDIGNDEDINPKRLPRETTFTIDHRSVGFQGFWNVRVVKCQRARNGYMRVVFEDSRWHLHQHTFGKNYNLRDELGNVLSSTRKTVPELLQEISDASDKKVIFQGSNGGFYPPARWAGKTCMECLEDLLKNTGMRCVYNPATGTYRVSLQSGGPPNIPQAVFQPAPPSRVKEVVVRSYPTLYETEIEVEAAKVDSTGQAVAIGNGPLDDEVTDQDSQVRFRLWKPTGQTGENKLITEFRPKSHMYDPTRQTMQRGRIVRDEWPPFPVHQPFVFQGNEIVDSIEDTSGGIVFVTEHPVLSADGNNYSLEAKMITGYYQIDPQSKKPIRVSEKVTIDNRQNAVVNLYVDWIRPIDSDQPDIGTPVWNNLLKSVAQDLATKYVGPSGTVSSPIPINFSGNAMVGEVEYDYRLAEIRSTHNFRVAWGFTPGSEGEIR